jgi:hypothetical protein
MFKEAGNNSNFKEQHDSSRFSRGDIKEETERLRRENEEKMRKMKEERESREKEKNEKKREENKAKKEDIDEKRKKYAKEFPKKPLNADKVEPNKYTKEMFDEDLGYLKEWIDFEVGKTMWMVEELFIEGKRRMDAAGTREEIEEIKKWVFSSKEELYDQKNRLWSEYHKEYSRIKDILHYKRDPDKEDEERKKKEE